SAPPLSRGGAGKVDPEESKQFRYLRSHDLVAPGTITDNCYDHCILLEKFKNSLEHKPGKDISWCSSFAGDWLYPVTE
ncbi:hypothetical protein MTO96_040391, partial [Rhipicephalus appendiculatus]